MNYGEMKLLRLLHFIIFEVFWGGLKFYLEIPFYVWKKFQEKEKERKKEDELVIDNDKDLYALHKAIMDKPIVDEEVDTSDYEVDVDEYLKTGEPVQKVPEDKRAEEDAYEPSEEPIGGDIENDQKTIGLPKNKRSKASSEALVPTSIPTLLLTALKAISEDILSVSAISSAL